MIKKINIFIAYFGVITVFLFLFLIIIGVFFDANYSFLYREISYFISPYITGKHVITPLFQLYNLGLISFSFGLSMRFKNAYGKAASIFLALSGFTGIILIWFPMDPPLAPPTNTGLYHILVLALMSLFTVIALLLFAKTFHQMRNLLWLSKFTYVISLLLFDSALITLLLALNQNSAMVGILEKLPIGSFLLWIIIVAFGMLGSDKRVKYRLVKTS